MKKTIGFIFALAVFTFGLATTESFAQKRYHTVNKRQAHQDKRIRQGIRSGQLTSREVYRLQRQQGRIANMESRYRRSGGGLSWRERYIINQRQSRASRNIYRQKHDRQKYPRSTRRYTSYRRL